MARNSYNADRNQYAVRYRRALTDGWEYQNVTDREEAETVRAKRAAEGLDDDGVTGVDFTLYQVVVLGPQGFWVPVPELNGGLSK